MARRQSIRNRRSKRKINENFDLQLTSMMDILVILLVFLLKTFSLATTNFTSPPGMELPISVSKDTPPDSLHLVVAKDAISFEAERIMDFLPDGDAYRFDPKQLSEGGKLIVPLYQALVSARSKSEYLRTQSQARDEKGDPLPFEGILAIQADRQMSYDILRRVMYTAASADYKVFRFLAKKKE